ncbi:MAG: sigma-70 family RNA polymerase sigma factor [bacterium]
MKDEIEPGQLLVSEIIGGNTAAFETLIGRYQKLVTHVVFRMIANRCDQEDICQEVFIKVYRHLDSFKFESKLSTWIARIAYNTCLNHLEKKRLPLIDDLTDGDQGAEMFPDSGITPDRLTEQRDIAARVRAEIENLPTQFRVMLTMYHLDEMSYEEIAQVTEIPLGTVKSYLFRGRKHLKERLTEKYVVEDIWDRSI